MSVTDSYVSGPPVPTSHPVPAAVLPPQCLRQALLTLPAREAHVSAARHFTADLLDTWCVPEAARDAAVLIVDELAANAARYGHEVMTLLLALDHCSLHIVVADTGCPVEHLQEDIPDDEHGRGTGIVENLAQWTEVHQTVEGREVHACLQCAA